MIMKKISYILTAACAVWALSSCEDSKDPVYHAPVEGSFSLYTPAMQDQYIVLGEDGTLELTTSGQPDYGFSAVATYGAQLSLTNDFSDPEAVYDLTPVDLHQSKILLKQNDVAQGFCALMGIEDEDTYNGLYPDGAPAMPLYFRATCSINGIEDSGIISNVVAYNHLVPYFAVAVPGYIYLVGNMPDNEWNEPNAGNASIYANWRLFEPANAIGSKIYSGVFELGAAPMFRFYTALTGWDADSYGYIVDDNATDFPDFTGEGSWTGSMIKGKGAYSFPNFAGGQVTIVVDMSVENNMTVTVTAGAVDVFVPNYIYLMGDIFGWAAPTEANAALYKDAAMPNSSSALSVYTGSFDVEAKEYYIRFVTSLDDEGLEWDNPHQIGPLPDDQTNIEVTFSNNTFSSDYVSGKGSWYLNLTEPGKLDISVDTDNKTATFTFIPS